MKKPSRIPIFNLTPLQQFDYPIRSFVNSDTMNQIKVKNKEMIFQP